MCLILQNLLQTGGRTAKRIRFSEKKISMKKIALIIAISVLLQIACAQDIGIGSYTQSEGELKVNVEINATNALGASFDLIFDEDILKAMGVEEGAFMKKCKSSTFDIRNPIISAGKIEFQDLCFGETMSGKGTIAIITFRVKSAGESDLVLQNAHIFDKNGNPMKNIRVTNGRIALSSITSGTDYQRSSESASTSNNSEKTPTFDVFVSSNHPSEGEKVAVTVFSDGDVLSGVLVIYNGSTYYTDADGTVELVAVGGENSILIKKEGYEDKEVPLDVSSQSSAASSTDTLVIFIVPVSLVILISLVIIIAYKKFKSASF